MAPKKRKRASAAASPTPTSQPKTPTPAASSPSKSEDQVLNDPWTTDEEIGLFKGLMRWKPTGIHKHFHLLALHQHLLDGGYVHPRTEHTKPAGIWRKLQTLYNLEALDEREDARQLDKVEIPKTGSDEASSSADDDADVYSEAANKIENDDFNLPGEEFAERKWARRLATAKERRSESPPLLPELNMASEPPVRFTPSFSIEPSETATATPTPRKAGRPRAGTGGARGRQSGAATSTRRSMRQVESVADENEQEETGEENEDEEESEEEEEEQSEESTPAPRSTRGTKGARGRPAPKSGKRGRGRKR